MAPTGLSIYTGVKRRHPVFHPMNGTPDGHRRGPVNHVLPAWDWPDDGVAGRQCRSPSQLCFTAAVTGEGQLVELSLSDVGAGRSLAIWACLRRRA